MKKTELIVIDEVGFVPLHKDAAELLFQVISDCYERKSLIITFGCPPTESGQNLFRFCPDLCCLRYLIIFWPLAALHAEYAGLPETVL